VQLHGSVLSTGTSVTVNWTVYSGLGPVAFSAADQTNATAQFTVPGEYLLRLSVDDGVHATAYDAVAVRVTDALTPGLAIRRTGMNVAISWSPMSTNESVILQETGSVEAGAWTNCLQTTSGPAILPVESGGRFFRLLRSN
jgi:hypothetical protein